MGWAGVPGGCRTIHPKTWWHKNHHFIMQTDSVGQDSRQGTVGMACLCPWVSGSQLRVMQKAGVWQV